MKGTLPTFPPKKGKEKKLLEARACWGLLLFFVKHPIKPWQQAVPTVKIDGTPIFLIEKMEKEPQQSKE